MKMLKKFQFGTMVLAAAFLLSACIPGATVDGTTIDATQAAQLIETAVAQALDAQATQLAEAVPQATATLVPVEEATSTSMPIPPTLTPFPTITPLVLVPPSGGGGDTTVTIPEYRCDPDIAKRPYDNTSYPPGDTSFDVKFTIENTGTSTWPAGYDLVHSGGPNMAPGFPAFIELPEMKPGDRFSVGPYDGVAPNEKGRQVMVFKLENGFCFPYIAINVE